MDLRHTPNPQGQQWDHAQWRWEGESAIHYVKSHYYTAVNEYMQNYKNRFEWKMPRGEDIKTSQHYTACVMCLYCTTPSWHSSVMPQQPEETEITTEFWKEVNNQERTEEEGTGCKVPVLTCVDVCRWTFWFLVVDFHKDTQEIRFKWVGKNCK